MIEIETAIVYKDFGVFIGLFFDYIFFAPLNLNIYLILMIKC
jgi:hypothetical protein